MVMRWIRFSLYSSVISSADSMRSPRSILARSSLSVTRPPMSAPFHHPHRLALASRNGLGRHDGHDQIEPQVAPEHLPYPGRQPPHLGPRRVEAAPRDDARLGRFHVHLQGREARRAVHHKLIMRRQLVQRQQGRFELGGVDVHALDHQHVVGPALDPRDPRRGPSAAAGRGIETREVARPVANHGKRFLGQAGKDQLALRALREGVDRDRIDDLGEEVIVVHVKAVADLHALHGHPGADDLAETVAVHRAKPPQRFDLTAHGLGPRLRAENSVAHADRARIQALLAHGLRDVERERRRARQSLRMEILKEQDLPESVARGDGEHGHAHVLGPVVDAQTSREEPVAVGVVDQVPRLGAREGERAGHDLPPHLEIAPRVAHDRGLALGARGGMHADKGLAGNGEETPRILFAEMALAREGQPREIVQALDGGWVHVRRREGLPVERHAFAGPGHRPPQPLELESAALGARSGLRRGIPDHRDSASVTRVTSQAWRDTKRMMLSISLTSAPGSRLTRSGSTWRTSGYETSTRKSVRTRGSGERKPRRPGSPGPGCQSGWKVAWRLWVVAAGLTAGARGEPGTARP